MPRTPLVDKLHQGVFDALYSRALVYNTCWEDPAVDRQALALGPQDTLLVITSAGCNVLDYALTGPRAIHAVDANPRQTALLELKLAAIRRLDHDDFFAVFGRGRHPGFRELWHDLLRAELSPFARHYWDRHLDWFAADPSGRGFYYHGLSGRVARAFQGYLRLRPRLRDGIGQALATRDLDRQREIYDTRIRPYLWSKGMNWTLSRQLTMSLLGVPHTQRREVQSQHPGGVAGFIREAIEYVFRCLPLWTNYFWNVYLRGGYDRDCCPEYLKRDNFLALKHGLAERISHHTCTVTDFLRRTDARISRFVLLDHMDWMSSHQPRALAEEWAAILDRAMPGARLIFRSAHADPGYLKTLAVPCPGGPRPLPELLGFDRELAARLQAQDRVHTYAGFHIARLRA